MPLASTLPKLFKALTPAKNGQANDETGGIEVFT
jgi:hypothetical protein